MPLVINRGTERAKWEGFPEDKHIAEVRADLDALHARERTGAQVRKKWGVEDLSRLHTWAYRIV